MALVFRKMFDETVLEFTGVDLLRDGRPILSRIGWQVRRNDRWIVWAQTVLARRRSAVSRGCIHIRHAGA